MEELYAGLFRAMNRFGKLRIGELFSDMTKSDGMMLWAISQLNQEKNNGRATVSELAEKLHTQNSAVSRTLKNLEDHGWICRMTDPKRPAQYLCRSDGEWGGHAAKYDMHLAGIWQGSHFADG